MKLTFFFLFYIFYFKSKSQRNRDDDDDEDDDDYALTDEDIADTYNDDVDESEYASTYDAKPKQDEEYWANTAETTRMWELISSENVNELKQWIRSDPDVVHVRSEDGRGPLWWAYEYGNKKIINMLLEAGVDGTQQDSSGSIASDMRKY